MADIVLKLKLDGKDYDAVIENADKQLSDLRKKTESFPDAASKWSNIVTGFNQGLELANKLYSQFKDNVLKGAELQELREGFKGTADDIEKFRQATMKNVTEANLIKLSNQATDLGITLKQQVILFSLADDAAGKYGGTVETNFQKIVNASEGSGKALKSLGIQAEVYNSIVEKNVKATGKKLDQLDAETVKEIKLNAIIEASGITLDDVNAKVMNNADKIGALGVRVDEARTKMGIWMTEAIIPLIDLLGESKDGKTGLSDAVITLGTHLPDVLISLFALKQLTGGATLAALGKYIALPVALGVGAGKIWNEWLHDELGAGGLSGRYEDSTYQQPLEDAPGFLSSNQRYVPGKGMINIVGDKNTVEDTKNKKKTIAELKQEIVSLNTELEGVEAGSKRHAQILARIKEINETIAPTDKAKTEALRLKNERDKEFLRLYREGLQNRKERILADKNLAGESAQANNASDDLVAEGTVKKKRSDKELYEDMSVEGKVFFDGMMGMTDTFWSNFIMSGRQAKDGWDALWLSFYNSAVQKLGDIIIDGFAQALMKMEAGDVWDTVFNVLSSFVSLFTGVPTPGTGGGGDIIVKPLSGGGSAVDYANARVEKMLNNYFNKIDDWQKNIVLEANIKNNQIHLSNIRGADIRRERRLNED